MLTAARALLIRDLKLSVRLGGGAGMAVFFFLVVGALIPFGVGPDQAFLRGIAPGMCWIAVLLASLLSLDRMFQADFEDGSLDLLLSGGMPGELLVAVKAFTHWLTTGLPLLVAAPLLAVMLNLDLSGLPLFLVSLLVGGPALSFLGAIGAALTMSVRRGGLLASLLVIPFYIPVLIFGVGASEAAMTGTPDQAGYASLMLLGAVSLVSFVLAPLAGGAAIRASLG